MDIGEKILKGKLLTEEEAKSIVWGMDDDDFTLIREIEGKESRWTREMTTIFLYKDQFYAINWERGLTEYQENEFWDCCPYRVEKRTKTITVTEYVPVEEE